ncbi:ATP-dependent RNA helicase DBP9 [Xylariaceae sp. FL1019]|nr:ATP-dependent RNA helicase DBP9 [Xylariaceae sp. FL1019]
MKRKLDQRDDQAVAATSADHATTPKTPSEPVFTDFGLDPRLLSSISRLSYHKPTTPQAAAIPKILEGHSVCLKAKTGSGKTAAYLLPLIQIILGAKQHSTALVLVPTRELATQVHQNIETLSSFCQKDISALKLSDNLSPDVQRSLLASSPNIVVATPSRASSALQNSAFLQDLKVLVLDEADLVLSYGYEEDLHAIASSLPKGGVQTVLTSATLTGEVDKLTTLFCKNPVVLDLEEPDAEGEGITQYVVKCSEEDKFLLLYVLLKLKLISGKSLIFVADVDRSYRLKLFLEQFGIRSAVLNSRLPINSRTNIVTQFNQGLYHILIGSDETEMLGDEEGLDAEHDEANENEADEKDQDSSYKRSKKSGDDAPLQKKRKPSRNDKDYGVSRGIDFKNLSMVVNFDCPKNARSYSHRIGRTARAGQTGSALTFIVPSGLYRKHVATSIPQCEFDEKTLQKITKQQAAKGKEVKPWVFDMKTLEGFRYRLNDALRAVTKVAIREAQTRELRQEIIKSEKLQRRFEENPAELRALRHDGQLRAARTQAHLKDVPDYLLPEGKKKLTASDIGFVPLKKASDGKNRKGRFFKNKSKRSSARKIDPLKSFKARPKGKK